MNSPFDSWDFWKTFDDVKKRIPSNVPVLSGLGEWAGSAASTAGDIAGNVANGIGTSVGNWFNPSQNPRNQNMTGEQIAWENPGAMTKPEGDVPLAHFARDAWAGATAPTDPKVHMLSTIRDAPVVGGAIRAGELAMNGLQALQEGLLVPAIGSLVDGVANNSFDAIGGKNGAYETAREAFYKMPLPVQLAANFVDPIQAAAGGVYGVAKMVKPLRAMDAAMDVAKAAGDVEAVGRLNSLAGQVKAALQPKAGLLAPLGKVDTNMAEKAIKGSLPYINHDTRSVIQIANAAVNEGKFGLGKGLVKEGGEAVNFYERAGKAPTMLERIGSMIDPLRPTNANQRGRIMDSAGEQITLLQQASKGDPIAFARNFMDILNSSEPGVADRLRATGLGGFVDSTEGKRMQAIFRTMLAKDDVVDKVRVTGPVDSGALDGIIAAANKKVLGLRDAKTTVFTPDELVTVGKEAVDGLIRKMDDTLKLFYPDQPMNPVQKLLGAFKNKSATYLYMGYSPGYVARNIISNYIPAIIDGTFSMQSAKSQMEIANMMGVTLAMQRGLGAAEVGWKAAETMGKGYVQTLKEGSWKGLLKGPMLAMGQVAEQHASLSIAVNSMIRSYNKFWASPFVRPMMDDGLKAALGKNASYVEGVISRAYNAKGLDAALEGLAGQGGMTRLRTQGPTELLAQAHELEQKELVSQGFTKEVDDIFKNSGGKTYEDVVGEFAALQNEKYTMMRKTADHATDEEVAGLADKVAEAVGKGKKEKDAIIEAVDHAADVRRKAIDAPYFALRAELKDDTPQAIRAAFNSVDDEKFFYETVGWWRRNKYQNLTNRWEDVELQAKLLSNPSRPFFGDGATTSAGYLQLHHAGDPILGTTRETHVGRKTPAYQFIVDTFNDEREIMQPKIDALKSVVTGPKPTTVTDEMRAGLAKLGYSPVDIAGKDVDEVQGILGASKRKIAEASPMAAPAAPVAANVPPQAVTPVVQAAPKPIQAPVTASVVQAEGAKAMNDQMATLIAQARAWAKANWDEMADPVDTETYKLTKEWIDAKVKPAQMQAVLASHQYGVAMRDAALHNYSDRRNFDTLLNYIYPFSYWYTRSGMAYADRAMRNPALLMSYMDAMQKMSDANKDLPLSWQNQVQITAGDNPMFINMRALVDPLYQSMSNAMSAAYKSGGGTVEGALAQLGGWGPSLQAPLVYAMAGMGQFSDNNDWINYQASLTRPIKALSALARSAGIAENIIPPGGWTIEGPIRQIASPAFATAGNIGRPYVDAAGYALLGDKYKPNPASGNIQRQDPSELTRAAKYLATEFQKGTINPETGQPITKDDVNKAMQLQSGALWDMARQLEGQGQALPNLTSALTGARVVRHDIDEQQLQDSRDEYYTKIKPLYGTPAYTPAMNDFKARYPWYFSLSGVKYNDTPELKQKAYETGRGYTILMERVPPGYQQGMSVADKALISKFFDLKGAFEKFTTTEQKRFSVMMDDLEQKYPTAPTTQEQADRAQAKAENTAYWLLPAGKERTAFKKSHPVWAKFYAGKPFLVTPKQ